MDLIVKKLMTKSFDKFKKPYFWPNLDQFSPFSLLHTTPYGFLTPCQYLEQTNDSIPRKCQYGETDRQIDKRADRSFFIGPYPLPPRFYNENVYCQQCMSLEYLNSYFCLMASVRFTYFNYIRLFLEQLSNFCFYLYCIFMSQLKI